MIDMIDSKNILIKVKYALIILFYIFILCIFTGCTFYEMIKESYGGEEGIELPDVRIDEEEISEIGKENINIEKSYSVEGDIGLIDESARNPFEPFYIRSEEEEEKNVLELESIYVEDEVEYAELSLNDHLYELKEGDLLGDIYSVQAINEDSVVLLKGDDILAIYLGSVVYD